jgi:hypothetical protein
VRHWLVTAAEVPGFIRFAVGRTDFLGSVGRLADQEGDAGAGCCRDREALSEKFVDLFEKADVRR